MIRTWKVVPDSEVIKHECPSCRQPAGRTCSYADAEVKGKGERKKGRKSGMHFARWEAAYTALYGPPRVPSWAPNDGMISHGMFNGQDFGAHARPSDR